MFKSLIKGIRNSVDTTKEFVKNLGPSQSTVLRTAIITGDEEKAIQVYTTDSKGRPLDVFINPSLPFEAKRYHEATPLHLAALMCFEKLIDLFLENNGNPNVLNANHGTALHALCSKGDFPELRAKVLKKFLKWKRVSKSSSSENSSLGEIETVSINRVDDEGNAAIHHAAINGLELCVSLLIHAGAITSIVNYSQRTCCELADTNSHKELGTMIELALVFQPEDENMIAFRLSQSQTNTASRRNISNSNSSPVSLTIDSISMELSDIEEYLSSLIHQVCMYIMYHFHNNTLSYGKISISPSRAEALLNILGWDFNEVENEMMKDSGAVLKLAHLNAEVSVDHSYIYETDTIATSKVSISKVPSNTTIDKIKSNSSNSNIQCQQQDVNNIATGVSKSRNELQSSFTGINACSICGETMLPPTDHFQLLKEARRSCKEGRELNDTFSQCCVTCGAGHSYCLSCWSTHIRTQVNDNGSHILSCPGFKCGEILPLSWAEIILKDSTTITRWKDQRLRHAVDCSKRMRWCSHEGCNLAIRWETSQISLPDVSFFDATIMPQNLVCSNGHAFCFQCNEEAHAPCSCTNWKKWKVRVDKEFKHLEKTINDMKNNSSSISKVIEGGDDVDNDNGISQNKTKGDDIANALWVAANTKKCPRCATPIEKDEGCNHMACRKCRHEFCWICMKDWHTHSQQTGGYFQCNRFQADGNNDNTTSDLANRDPNDDNDDDDGETILGGKATDAYFAMFPDEAGNAHMESLRMKNKGLRMARFIHHFTRFQAHSDSAAMESRLKTITVGRIAQGLIDSIPKSGSKLKWFQGETIPHPLLKSNLSSSHHNQQNNINTISTASNIESSSLLSSNKVNNKVVSTSTSSSSSSSTKQSGDNLSIEMVISDYLSFLTEGFEELQRCRQFLKGSFAFAYYAFSDDYDSYFHRIEEMSELLNQTAITNPETMDTIHAKRRKQKLKRRMQHTMNMRKTEFEQFQSELESLTEMLSDILARRRLRAGKTQIIEATFAARNKRIEFEDILSSWATIDRFEADAYINDTSSNSSSSSNMSSSDMMRRLMRKLARQHRHRGGGTNRNIVAGLAGFDLSNDRNASGEDSGHEDGSSGDLNDNIPRMLALLADSSRRGSNGDIDDEDEPLGNITTGNRSTVSTSTNNRTGGRRSRNHDMSGNELLDLNRAIMLSLIESHTDTTNGGNATTLPRKGQNNNLNDGGDSAGILDINSGSGNNSSSSSTAAQQSVSTSAESTVGVRATRSTDTLVNDLEAMGFPRLQAAAALASCYGNFEQALDMLISQS